MKKHEKNEIFLKHNIECLLPLFVLSFDFQEFTKDILCNKQNVGHISKTSIYLFLTGFCSSFVCFFKKMHPCRVSSVKGRGESIQYILRIHCIMDLQQRDYYRFIKKITRNMSNYPWLKSCLPCAVKIY